MYMTENHIENIAKLIVLKGIGGIKEFCALSTYERCCLIEKQYKDVEGMEEFLNSGDHLRFEQYDLDNTGVVLLIGDGVAVIAGLKKVEAGEVDERIK